LFESDEIEVEEISLGGLVARHVKAITHEMPRLAGVEGILGVSFLSSSRPVLISRRVI
jgi:hypothetical protein